MVAPPKTYLETAAAGRRQPKTKATIQTNVPRVATWYRSSTCTMEVWRVPFRTSVYLSHVCVVVWWSMSS